MRELTSLEDTLRELVTIQSVSGDLNSAKEVVTYVKNRLKPYDLHVQEFEDEGYPILFISTKPTMKPQTLLVAHADVLPAGDALFQLRPDEHALHGRGVWDMKFAIAGYIELVESLGNNLQKYDFGILITSDEETRNKNAAFVIKKGIIPKNVILLDGSTDWQIESVAKGALTVKLTARGTSSHGARPWEGSSASLLLLDTIQAIRMWFPDPNPESRTLNISLIRGGQAVNQLPEEVAVWLDMRFPSNEDKRIIHQKLSELTKNNFLDLEVLVDFPVLEHDLTNYYLKTFLEASSGVTGASKAGIISLGASDATHFMQAGIPCIVTRPTGGGHHADNEWVDRESLNQIVPLLTDYLLRLNTESL